jgi:hypothetical protein
MSLKVVPAKHQHQFHHFCQPGQDIYRVVMFDGAFFVTGVVLPNPLTMGRKPKIHLGGFERAN